MKLSKLFFFYLFIFLTLFFAALSVVVYLSCHNLDLKLFIVYALFTAAAFYISYLFGKRVKKDIHKIREHIEALSKKEFERFDVLDEHFIKEFEKIDLDLKKLSKKIKKRDEKKKEYTKKLKQVNRQRSELISAISHEFKNPVAIIDGYAQTLLEDRNLDEKLRMKFLEKIHSASKKISNMIDRLSIAIKFENNDLQPKKTEFDLCEVVCDVSKLMQDRYKNRKISTECKPYKVFADKMMIEMVLINLIDNAVKYSEMDVRVILENGEVKVIDKGIGIKSQDIEKITKKFYRARRNSWDNSMGLGLYLVSYILELHNSKLQIKSTYGKGSTFSFTL